MSIQLIKEIKELLPIKKKLDGTMDFSSFIEVYYRVNKYAKAAFNQDKKDFLAKRRDCLAKGRMEEYEALVTEMS